MSDTLAETERKILACALSIYKTPDERAAMRGALGDAAALCDALATQIGHEHRSRGVIKKQGLALAAAVTKAADAIWQMREKIEVHETPPPDAQSAGGGWVGG